MVRFRYYFILFLSIFISSASAQNDDSWKIYDDSQVAQVDITVEPEHLAFMYNDPYADTLFPATFHFQNNFIDETVENIGFGIRGNTSRASEKKSFKVSFNEFEPGREFYDVDKLNLNGEHNDPSIIRSKICWDIFNEIGMLSSRVNHTEVYINGQYYGLYISVEHIDDEFLDKNFSDDSGNLWKCLYPADLVYLGNDPDLYKFEENGRRAYELKTNEAEDDYSQLARLIDLINNTPNENFRDSIEKVLSVDEVLKYFAINVITGGWDSYRFLRNNYYLYHQPEENKFHWIPYDYDNTFGIDWFDVDWGNVSPYSWANIDGTDRPLSERLLSTPEYKNLFTHFIQFYSENVFNFSLWNERIENTRIMITEYAQQDTFRTKDYGFTFADFLNSYSSSGYSNQHVKYGLKEFIIDRVNSLDDQLNYVQSSPVIYEADYQPKILGGEDTVDIYASVFFPASSGTVEVEFSTDSSQIIFDRPLNYSPAPGTKKVEEFDRWNVKLPAEEIETANYFRIYASDGEGNSQYYPANGFIKIKIPDLITDNVLINEFLAINDNSNPDPAGEFDDWVELYNPLSTSIDLTGKYLTDDPDSLDKWQFPSVEIQPAEFVIIWCDEDLEQEGLHAGFRIDGDGEFLALVDNDGTTIIDSVSFGNQQADISFGRYPDASEQWAFLRPTPGSNNVLTSVESKNIIPDNFQIAAYPNPFNPATTIRYSLPERSDIQIKILDIMGREIFSKRFGIKSAGTYEFKWNGKNNFNEKLSSGIYLFNLSAGKYNSTIKLLKLK